MGHSMLGLPWRMAKAEVSAGQGSPEALYTVEADMGAGPEGPRAIHIEDMLAGQLRKKWMQALMVTGLYKQRAPWQDS